MSLGRFCPLAVVGERLGLLGAKPPMQQGSGCVGHSQMPLERRPLARLAAEGPGELKGQHITSRLDGCLRCCPGTVRAGGAAVGPQVGGLSASMLLFLFCCSIAEGGKLPEWACA